MTHRKPFLVLAFVCALGGVGRAQMTTSDLTGSITAANLAAALVGGPLGSVVVSNVTFAGNPLALGAFATAPACLGFDSGVILTSGRVDSAPGPNNSIANGQPMGTGGDASLDAIVGGGTQDAAVLEFDITPGAGVTTLAFQYVFGSDEYNGYVNTNFNDVFALFVNGENKALVPNTETAVSINTVNNGNPLGINASNPQFYVNNELNPAPCNVQPDGFTTVLTLVAPVTPNETNHLKLAIADRGDAAFNSWVFIKSGSIVVGDTLVDLALTKHAPEGAPSVGADTSWTLQYSNAGPDVAKAVVITDTLPPDTVFVRSEPPVCSAAGSVVTCNVPDVDPEDETQTLTIVTSTSTVGSKTNSASIDSTDSQTLDTNGTNDTGTATLEFGCDEGNPCDDRNGCTQTDVCQGGACVGSNPKPCTAIDACHVAGVCESSTGLCTNPPGNDGARCGDGNACNGDEVCQTGLCVSPITSQTIACLAESFTGFISHFESNTVSILDPDATAFTGDVPVPNGPWGVAIHPNGTEAWITQRNGRSVAVIDPTTRTVAATIPVGGTPLGVTIHPSGLRAYVANYDDDRVTVIDTVSRTVIGSIPVAAGPSAFTFNAAATRLYVSGFAGNAVSVIDTASNGVITNVPTGVQPLGMALDRSRGRLYVANYEGASVTVIGTVSNTVLGTVPAGQRPFGVVTDPARSRVYVTNASSDSITVIDAGNLGVIGTIAEVGRAPFGIGLDLTGTRAFVANAGDNTLAVIDTSSLAVARKIGTGQQPIAFGSFLASMASDCPLPAPVCTDDDPTTTESCSAIDGCQYAVRGAGGTLAAALQTIGQTISGAGGALGGSKGALEQQLDNATSQVTPVIGSLTPSGIHTNAKPAAATRKRLKRIDRALGKFLRTLQKGLRKRTVQRDIGLRLLDLVRAAQSATQAALGGKAAVKPSNGLLTPLPLSASRTARPRPPLP